jgi:hypothetical protein
LPALLGAATVDPAKKKQDQACMPVLVSAIAIVTARIPFLCLHTKLIPVARENIEGINHYLSNTVSRSCRAGEQRYSSYLKPALVVLTYQPQKGGRTTTCATDAPKAYDLPVQRDSFCQILPGNKVGSSAVEWNILWGEGSGANTVCNANTCERWQQSTKLHARSRKERKTYTSGSFAGHGLPS